MADYKEKLVTGKTWQRGRRAVFEYPSDATPSAIFVEEKVTLVEGEKTLTACGNLPIEFDAEKRFPLIDLETGANIPAAYLDGLVDAEGKIMVGHAFVFMVLSSLYMYEAAARDAAQVA